MVRKKRKEEGRSQAVWSKRAKESKGQSRGSNLRRQEGISLREVNAQGKYIYIYTRLTVTVYSRDLLDFVNQGYREENKYIN